MMAQVPDMLQKVQIDSRSMVPAPIRKPIRAKISEYRREGFQKALIDPLKAETMARYDQLKSSIQDKMGKDD